MFGMRITIVFDVCRITNGAHNETRYVTITTSRVLVYALQISLLCIAYFPWKTFLKKYRAFKINLYIQNRKKCFN